MGAAGVAARLLRRQPAVALFCATEQELARKYKGAIKFPCTSGLNLLGKRRDAQPAPAPRRLGSRRGGAIGCDGRKEPVHPYDELLSPLR